MIIHAVFTAKPIMPADFTARLGIIINADFLLDLAPLWSNLVYRPGSLRCCELILWPFGIESLAGSSLMVAQHTLISGGRPSNSGG